jgi:hypothetical protein
MVGQLYHFGGFAVKPNLRLAPPKEILRRDVWGEMDLWYGGRTKGRSLRTLRA